ncbi:MAG: hypothetical protein JWO12_3599 [Frankiales bacterium]|nr:hypothetical protein [Frankiales bacterium]
MNVRRTTARSLGALALAAPMLVGLSAFGPSALAATGPAAFDSATPPDGTVFTGADTAVTVSATLPACTKQTLGNGCASTVSSTLALSAPGQPGQSITKKSTTSAQDLTLVVPAGSPNAVWTVTLTSSPTRSFTIDQVNVPESFSAEGSGTRNVAFAWNKGGESGITGYVLATSDGSVLDDQITPEEAGCASTDRCTYGYYYAANNPGTHGYQLTAKRTSSSGGTVTSEAATATATLEAPPKPSPTPNATAGPGSTPAPGGGGTAAGGSTGTTSGGSSGSSASGTTSGGTTGGGTSSTSGTSPSGSTEPTLPPSATNPVLAGRKAFALTFNAFSPSLGIPKLPPLPATDLPSVSGEAPLPLGTFKPSLPYQGQTETTTTRHLLSSPTAFVETITDPEQLAKSIAAALLLLLVGAHLRRFLGTHVED